MRGFGLGSHPSREHLLRFADGEIGGWGAARIRAHVVRCWECRARMRKVEDAIAEFTGAYLDSCGRQPSPDGPRALLKARMREAGLTPRERGVQTRWQVAVGALALLILLWGIGNMVRSQHRRSQLGSAGYDFATPQYVLTPGAIRIVTRDQVCAAGSAGSEAYVPAPLKRRVFEEYGMSPSRAAAFEVDYLVTPELGGAQDIRNLWPQPYGSIVWNARVKDELEERLHQMVCSGEIDLATAQHDLAANWIDAYRKYFHRQQPI